MVRKIETYRAARRNEVRGTDQVALTFGEYPKVMRRSYVSKNQSKYMPHYNGGMFYEFVRPKKPKMDHIIDPLTGLPIISPILSTRERHNNRKRKNTKHRTWKKRRSSGLH